MGKIERVTQTQVLEMGFTKTMIQNLLPEPMFKENPHYRHAAPMKLWNKDEVKKVMQTEEYRVAWEKAKKRKAASKKSAKKTLETKRANTEKLVEEMKNLISVEIVADKEIIEKVIEEKNKWYYWHGKNEIEKWMIDEWTLKRWIVNYIRHELISYDYDLEKLHGRVGKDKAYVEYKTAVLQKIAEVYPKYAEECRNQIEDINIEYSYLKYCG